MFHVKHSVADMVSLKHTHEARSKGWADMDKAFWERFASLYDLAMNTRGGAADEAAAWAAARVAAPGARRG